MDRPAPFTFVASLTLDRFRGIPSEEVFAVGDVHGRSDLLELALRAIEGFPRRPGIDRRLVLLGDLIDRGAAGIECLDLARGAEARLGHPVTTLMGNHEMMLAIALTEGLHEDARAMFLRIWLDNGGDACVAELKSAGHDLSPPTADLIAHAMGPDRLDFVRGLPSHYRSAGSDVLFVHAGLHPYVPVDESLATDWREHAVVDFSEQRSWAWVRQPFLEYVPADRDEVGHQGLFVVHGHTPQDGVSRPVVNQVRRDRLNLDVMAVYRDRLRCALIHGHDVQVFEVSARTSHTAG